MVADIVAGYYSVHGAELYDQAAAALSASGNSTDASAALVAAAKEMISNSRLAVAARSVNNAFTLSVMTIAFTAVLSFSVMIFRVFENFGSRALLKTTQYPTKEQSHAHQMVNDTVDAAAEHRRHLTWANVIILATFPPCVGYYLLFAYANFNQVRIIRASALKPLISIVLLHLTTEQVQSDCGKVCDACQPQQFLIRKWMDATPEFWTLVCSVSSPLTMALCIWTVNRAHIRAMSIYANIRKSGVNFGQRVTAAKHKETVPL